MVKTSHTSMFMILVKNRFYQILPLDRTITSLPTSKKCFVMNNSQKREIWKGEKCHQPKMGRIVLSRLMSKGFYQSQVFLRSSQHKSVVLIFTVTCMQWIFGWNRYLNQTEIILLISVFIILRACKMTTTKAINLRIINRFYYCG
jgi:hypothetical protein